MNRGQTLTESLIILGVVIVLTLIVVGVMGGIPNMGGASEEKISKKDSAIWFCEQKNFSFDSYSPSGFLTGREFDKVYCYTVSEIGEIEQEVFFIVDLNLVMEAMNKLGWSKNATVRRGET